MRYDESRRRRNRLVGVELNIQRESRENGNKELREYCAL